MNLDYIPNFAPRFSNVIGVNSAHYIFLTPPQNCTHAIIHLYLHRNGRSTMMGIPPVKTLTRQFINSYSNQVNVTPYLKRHIVPYFNSLDEAYEWSGDEHWFCYKTLFYNNQQLLSTANSVAYIASAGWKYEKIGTHTPHVSSTGDINNLFLQEFSVHQQFKTPFHVNSIGHMNDYTLSSLNVGTSTKEYPNITNPFNANMTPITSCNASEYEIMFINHTGVWQLMPLAGKVTHSASVNKDTFTRNTFNYNTNFLEDKIGVYNIKSESKYLWNTIPFDESFFIYIEDIIYSPHIILINTINHSAERVYVKTANYNQLTHRNNKRNLSYAIEFTSQLKKIK